MLCWAAFTLPTSEMLHTHVFIPGRYEHGGRVRHELSQVTAFREVRCAHSVDTMLLGGLGMLGWPRARPPPPCQGQIRSTHMSRSPGLGLYAVRWLASPHPYLPSVPSPLTHLAASQWFSSRTSCPEHFKEQAGLPRPAAILEAEGCMQTTLPSAGLVADSHIRTHQQLVEDNSTAAVIWR